MESMVDPEPIQEEDGQDSNDHISPEKKRFLKICDGVKSVAPEVSWDEILFNTTDEAKRADFKLLGIAAGISSFHDRDKLNNAMQIIHAVLVGQASENPPSSSWIHTFMKQHGSDLSLAEIDELVKKIMSDATGHLLTKNDQGYNCTSLGWLVYQTYRRTKGDLLALEKSGDKDLYIPFEEIKNMLLQNEFGIEQDMFPLINAIKNSIKHLEEKAEELLFKDKIKEHIEKIYEIMKEVRKTPAWIRGEMRINQYFAIAQLFAEVYSKLFEMIGTNLDFQSVHVKIKSVHSPLPAMVNKIVETWDVRDWNKILGERPDTCIPISILVVWNQKAVANAVRGFFNPRFKDPDELLPDGSTPMQELEDASILMASAGQSTDEITDELIQQILSNPPSWDHELVFVKDIVRTSKRITSFLNIFMKGGLDLGEYKDVKDPHKYVREYRSHNITFIHGELKDMINTKEA